MMPQDCKILTIGDRCWGKGSTLSEALKNMRNQGGSKGAKYYIAYIIHPDSRVDDMGDICFPTGFAPKEFHRNIPKQKRSSTNK